MHKAHNNNWDTPNKQGQRKAAWKQLRIGHSYTSKTGGNTCSSSDQAVRHNSWKQPLSTALQHQVAWLPRLLVEDSLPLQSSYQSRPLVFPRLWSSGPPTPPSSVFLVSCIPVLMLIVRKSIVCARLQAHSDSFSCELKMNVDLLSEVVSTNSLLTWTTF